MKTRGRFLGLKQRRALPRCYYAFYAGSGRRRTLICFPGESLCRCLVAGKREGPRQRTMIALLSSVCKWAPRSPSDRRRDWPIQSQFQQRGGSSGAAQQSCRPLAARLEWHVRLAGWLACQHCLARGGGAHWRHCTGNSIAWRLRLINGRATLNVRSWSSWWSSSTGRQANLFSYL